MRVQFCTLALFFFSSALTVASSLGQYEVLTTNGKITGHPAPNVRNTVEFLGIPYAQPPIGPLRFAPPLPPDGNVSFVAANWGDDCPQTRSRPVDFPGFTPQAQDVIDAFAGGLGTPQSEDCLTLNIWAPASHKNLTKQPVSVFFHGGRFSIGNTHSPFYNGNRFSEGTGAVIVTLTYRLGVLGFPGALGGTQNLGLRDQRRAVEWVHENIAAFGGDAKKMTIFGQSSGGVAADWWTFAYKDKPLINGIIMESGNAFSFPMNSRELQASNWRNVSETLGCGAFDDMIGCVREKPWQDVLAAAARLPAASGGNPVRSTPAFYPTVDNQTVFSDYASLLREGRFAKIPQLLGNNHNEQGYYVIPAFGRGINTTAAQRDQFLLESFTCPNDFRARMGRANNVPTWMYRYFGDWANTRLYPNSSAYHGTELQMLFGNSGDVSGIPPSASQVQLTKVMQHAWFAFANDPVNGLSELGWPQFELGKKTLVRLGLENSPEPGFVKPEMYSGSCSNVVLAGGR